MALKIKLNPQLIHDDTMLNSATIATAARGEVGSDASAAMTRYTAGEVATT